ncbi:hypothetical protein [Dysgonomonas reticulitermitis]|nr:hypothetical protein FACS1894169_16280 [Bacteroidia bacterium]
MENLQQATDDFIEAMSSPLSSNEEVNSLLQGCFKHLADASKEDVNFFMNSRSFTVQRTFKNLRASIEIEEELTSEEIDNWLR